MWNNLEKMLKGSGGKPAIQEEALEKLPKSVDDATHRFIRLEIHANFFGLAPAG